MYNKIIKIQENLRDLRTQHNQLNVDVHLYGIYCSKDYEEERSLSLQIKQLEDEYIIEKSHLISYHLLYITSLKQLIQMFENKQLTRGTEINIEKLAKQIEILKLIYRNQWTEL